MMKTLSYGILWRKHFSILACGDSLSGYQTKRDVLLVETKFVIFEYLPGIIFELLISSNLQLSNSLCSLLLFSPQVFERSLFLLFLVGRRKVMKGFGKRVSSLVHKKASVDLQAVGGVDVDRGALAGPPGAVAEVVVVEAATLHAACNAQVKGYSRTRIIKTQVFSLTELLYCT